MPKVSDYFDIQYGAIKTPMKDLEDGSIPLITSGSMNNGIGGYFDIEPMYKNVITVPRTGSICHAFYHGYDCGINSDCMVLSPKKDFTLNELMYFVMCFREEKVRYNYGRKVTPERLGGTPFPDHIPEWVTNAEISDFSEFEKPITNEPVNLNQRKWRDFKYQDIFDIQKGERIRNRDMEDGNTPCVRPTSANNGVIKKIKRKPNHSGNVITVSYNGSVAEAFYQPVPIFALDDINVLYPKFDLTPQIAMFLIPLIRKEKYRFNYGRKWHVERMKESIIKLPVNDNEQPDWDFMQKYIEGLPYSSAIGVKIGVENTVA